MNQETENNLDSLAEEQNTENQQGAGPEAIQQPVESASQQSEGHGVQKRINQLTAEKYEALRRAQEAEKRLSQFQSPPEQRELPANPTGSPSLEQFDYDDEAYNAALVKHEVNKRFQDLEQQRTAKEREAFKNRVNAEYMKKVSSAKLPEDFSQSVESLMNSGIPLQEDVVLAIQQTPNAPHVAHYLGKNLDVAAQLAGMDPISAAMKLGDISARLSANQANASPGSSVPDPVVPVKSGTTHSPKNDFDMSLQEIVDRDLRALRGV